MRAVSFDVERHGLRSLCQCSRKWFADFTRPNARTQQRHGQDLRTIRHIVQNRWYAFHSLGVFDAQKRSDCTFDDAESHPVKDHSPKKPVQVRACSASELHLCPQHDAVFSQCGGRAGCCPPQWVALILVFHRNPSVARMLHRQCGRQRRKQRRNQVRITPVVAAGRHLDPYTSYRTPSKHRVISCTICA